jgi:hypothetical protein
MKLSRDRMVAAVAAALVVALLVTVGLALSAAGRTSTGEPRVVDAPGASLTTTASIGVDDGQDADVAPGITPVPRTPTDVTDPDFGTAGTPPATASESLSPAPAGDALAPVVKPPDRTVIAVPADDHTVGIRYAVVFEPYGIGPASNGPSIVVYVHSMMALGCVDSRLDLAGRSVVLELCDASITVGGRYEATVVAQKRKDRVVFVIEQVRPVQEE